MKKKHLLILLSLLLIINGCTQNRGSEYKLYFLGGQSNMEGYGYVEELPADLNKTFTGSYIYHTNPTPDDSLPEGKGLWTLLKPGHGVGFSTDGKINNYSDRFGCELTFAAKMSELDPGSKIAILKYSLGGTSIDKEAARNFGSWDPYYKDGEGINQYDHFLAAVKNALGVEDIDGDGRKDKLIPSGIIWMQGESDADVTADIAQRYYGNLKGLVSLMREALGSNDIPVVIGRISDSGNDPSGMVWEHGAIVRAAQHKLVNEDPNAAIVTETDNYSYSDPWHYDSDGFTDLGTRFALSLDSVSNR